MQTHYGTRSTCTRSTFEAFHFRAGTRALPLHVHVRRWRSDGAVASLLVYVPTLARWFEGDDMPPDVRAFALDALATYLDGEPVFAFTSGVCP